jgi:hypothetical protein
MLFGILVIVLVMYESLYCLRGDNFIVASFLGNQYRLCIQIEGEDEGEFNSGIVFIFPPFLAWGQVYPQPAFNMAMEKHASNARDGQRLTSVLVTADATAQLKPELEAIRKLTARFPILEQYWDLTEPQEMTYYKRSENGKEIVEVKKNAPCIAHILAREIDMTWYEALGRSIPHHELIDVLSIHEDVETTIKARLNDPDTLTGRAGFFLPTDDDDNPTLLFDINMTGAVIADTKTAEALSAETRALLEGKGIIENAKAVTEAIRLERVQVAQDGGREVLAARMLPQLQTNVTLVTSPDSLLTGALGKVVTPQPPGAPPTTT